MKLRKFEKSLKIISVVTVVMMILSIIMGWIYNKKIENAAKNEFGNIEGSEGGSVGNVGSDDVFK